MTINCFEFSIFCKQLEIIGHKIEDNSHTKHFFLCCFKIKKIAIVQIVPYVVVYVQTSHLFSSFGTKPIVFEWRIETRIYKLNCLTLWWLFSS